MKKVFILTILVFCFMVSYSNCGERTFDGEKTNEKLADPSVVAIYIGPSFPEQEFKKLKLPERFWGAYYRLIYTYGEIYYCITAELIGLYEESDPEVIYSYTIPLEGKDDYCVKGGVGFDRWIDHRTFETGKGWNKKIRINDNGKFTIID